MQPLYLFVWIIQSKYLGEVWLCALSISLLSSWITQITHFNSQYSYESSIILMNTTELYFLIWHFSYTRHAICLIGKAPSVTGTFSKRSNILKLHIKGHQTMILIQTEALGAAERRSRTGPHKAAEGHVVLANFPFRFCSGAEAWQLFVLAGHQPNQGAEMSTTHIQ